jgi:hypothetical protein
VASRSWVRLYINAGIFSVSGALQKGEAKMARPDRARHCARELAANPATEMWKTHQIKERTFLRHSGADSEGTRARHPADMQSGERERLVVLAFVDPRVAQNEPHPERT